MVRTSISTGSPPHCGLFDRLPDAARRRDVIVLDQNRVVEAHAVIGDAARGRRRLLQPPQTRRGFARIEHACTSCLPRDRRTGARASPRRESRCRKFSATRSHSSSVRARPRTVGDPVAFVAAESPSLMQRLEFFHAAAHLVNQREAARVPASTSALAREK